MTVEDSAKLFIFGALGFLFLLIQVFHVDPPVATLSLIMLGVSVMAYVAYKPSWKKPSLTIQQKVILLEFDFYKTLPLNERQEFERRISYLIEKKEFIGRKELIVTERMKVLIAATIAQIGFGYSFIALENFEKIIIFPKAYYSKYSNRYHKGEVNSSGVIVLSWEDFLHGFSVKDGFNVGLHEIAHAFQIEDVIPNSEYHYLQDVDLKRWNTVSKTEFNNIRQGNPSFIRSYAGTNRQEFFAVCVEQFFEQSEAFQAQLPELYRALSKLLRQDPLKAKR